MSELSNEQRASILARKIEEAQSQIAELEEAVANFKAKQADILGEGEHEVGDPVNGYHNIVVYQHKAFNAAYAKTKLSKEAIARASVQRTVFDSASAKAREYDAEGNIIKGLTEAEYALAQKPSDKLSVRIERLNTDD